MTTTMGDETRNSDKENSDSQTCPILTLGFSVGCDRIIEVDCLKDRCAWFEDRFDQCALLIIARELFDIAEGSISIMRIR